jgi:hypothetical protein
LERDNGHAFYAGLLHAFAAFFVLVLLQNFFTGKLKTKNELLFLIK